MLAALGFGRAKSRTGARTEHDFAAERNGSGAIPPEAI